MIKVENVKYTVVKEPFPGLPEEQPRLPDAVYEQRLNKTLAAMKAHNLDYLLIYADREDYGNFDYLTGFGPRFEEAILVMDKTGQIHLLLGNECFSMYKYSRLPAEGILCKALSLPNQPMDGQKDLNEILNEIGINNSHKVGIVGWKLIYPDFGSRYMFDVPSFIVESVRTIVGDEKAINVTDLFIHPEYGVRVINGADEIAFFEFGAAYASDAVQQMLLNLRVGLNEVEISQFGTAGSLPTTCFPKVLSGHRIDENMVSPTTNELKLGDRFHVNMGIIGGLSNRRGFLAYSEDDLPEKSRDWLENIAKPYFAVAANWFENIGLGILGGDIYDMVETTYPKLKYGWFLNPGHLIGTEEWLSSPIFKDSNITIKSGMYFQMDIIPFVDTHYAAPDFEDGVVIADETLRSELKNKYPSVYRRIEERRDFMINELNINLKPEVLPLSNITGLFRPYMLNKDKAFVVEK